MHHDARDGFSNRFKFSGAGSTGPRICPSQTSWRRRRSATACTARVRRRSNSSAVPIGRLI